MGASCPVYLDYNATTPLDERVLDAMLPYLREHWGNAASRSHPLAAASLRFSLGRGTTAGDIEVAHSIVVRTVGELRARRPVASA